jgi:para-nitrobenzyl esterase
MTPHPAPAGSPEGEPLEVATPAPYYPRMWRVAMIAVLASCGGEAADPLRVRIDTGVVHGVQDGNVRAFLGVPYAAPPVGPDRWRPPQPALPLAGELDAFEVGIQCPQSFSLSGPGGDEDCLFVNVWTPDGKGRDLAVMVWLHGGAFIFGSGGDRYYDGKYLAETYGVVVVTVNYRLGAFGFFAHPELAAEDPAYPSSGNYGLDDQLAALQWVQNNIAAFGGDPAQVLLFGESAGGFSTCAHYVSPRSAGLFRAAISESGLCASSVTEPSRAQAEAAGVAIAEGLGCTGAGAIECMRGKPADELLEATAVPPPAEQEPGGPFYAGANLLTTLPNVDGFVLARSLRESFAAGEFEPRPIIVGANRDEGTLFHSVFFATEVADEAEYRAALGRRFGAANVDAIVAMYPVASFDSANRALAEVTGDAFFACAARRTARGAAEAGAPVYLYSFQREPDQPFLGGLGVFHSAEIPFLFNSDPTFPLGRVGSGQSVADTLQGYWTRFAATTDPNGGGGGTAAWPRYDVAGDRHLVIDATTIEGSAFKAALCDFWDALVIAPQ